MHRDSILTNHIPLPSKRSSCGNFPRNLTTRATYATSSAAAPLKVMASLPRVFSATDAVAVVPSASYNSEQREWLQVRHGCDTLMTQNSLPSKRGSCRHFPREPTKLATEPPNTSSSTRSQTSSMRSVARLKWPALDVRTVHHECATLSKARRVATSAPRQHPDESLTNPVALEEEQLSELS